MIDRAQAEDKPMVTTGSRDERIREAAHRRYRERIDGDVEGDETSDWLHAEAQIVAEDSEGSGRE